MLQRVLKPTGLALALALCLATTTASSSVGVETISAYQGSNIYKANEKIGASSQIMRGASTEVGEGGEEGGIFLLVCM